MTPTEILAVVFSVLCVVLSIRRNVLNWPAGLVGVTAYAILFFREKLYADLVLQVFFFLQGVYGWLSWSHSQEQDHDILVSLLTDKQRIFYVLVIALISFVWGFSLSQFTDASVPYIDAFASTTSFVANWLMARRKIESWILWFTADSVYIGLFWYKELYLSSGIYTVFTIMAITGFLEWRRKSLSTASR